MKRLIKGELFYFKKNIATQVAIGVWILLMTTLTIFTKYRIDFASVFVLVACVTVMNKDKKSEALKNVVGSGYSYKQIVIAKYITSLIISFVIVCIGISFSGFMNLKEGKEFFTVYGLVDGLITLEKMFVLVSIMAIITSSALSTFLATAYLYMFEVSMSLISTVLETDISKYTFMGLETAVARDEVTSSVYVYWAIDTVLIIGVVIFAIKFYEKINSK